MQVYLKSDLISEARKRRLGNRRGVYVRYSVTKGKVDGGIIDGVEGFPGMLEEKELRGGRGGRWEVAWGNGRPHDGIPVVTFFLVFIKTFWLHPPSFSPAFLTTILYHYQPHKPPLPRKRNKLSHTLSTKKEE